jgi:hypothetical protein
MRFVDGLREDIKSIVMIHRPATLDTTCALAMVQEEVIESHKKHEFRRYEPTSSRQLARAMSSLSLSSPVDKTVGASSLSAEESVKTVSIDEKLRTLK